MGHSNNQPPFKRGHTLFDKPTSNTSLATTDGAEIEGQIWEFPDTNPHTGVPRSNRTVKCMAVRWTGTTPNFALPKRLITLDAHRTSNLGGTAVGGAIGLARSNQMSRVGITASVLPAKGYPADEYLPTAGVATNDIFWAVIEGPALVYTPNTDFTDITVGGALIAVTSTTAGLTNGTTLVGLVELVDTAATTHPDGLLNRVVGAALSAATTGQQDILCDVGSWRT